MGHGDVALVQRAKQGDVEAFTRLAARYKDRIYNYVARVCGDRSEAEDLTQEVFIRAFVAMRRFRGTATFQTWLYKIATNMALDALRRKRRAGPPALSLDAPIETEESPVQRELADTSKDPHETAAARELQDEVRQAITGLSEKLRLVIVLFDIQGLSYEEIADVLGLPLGTVKSRLFNARMALRERLKRYVEQ
ncbi:MAG: sigma-70 family RNA polymerase sigma factor [Armatimonadota bacterium]|jgi:RNA polymerase sigma-70 factor (ECF subfamily)